MDLFFTLSMRIVPLLFLVAIGFVAGRKLRIDRTSIGNLVIYIVSPVVFFTSILQLDRDPVLALSPVVVFSVCSAVALVTYRFARESFDPAERSLLGFGAGDANSGYFGLPVAVALFGNDILGRFVLTIAGFIVYENTVGYYLLARGKFGPKDALGRLARLPAIYAIGAAVALNFAGLRLEGYDLDFAGYFKGAYSILGMMLVGLGLSELRSLAFETRSTAVLFAAKFVLWPMTIAGVIALDRSFGPYFPREIHAVWLLLSCCPLAANTVAFATIFDITPERAAYTVLLSTIVAVFVIPMVMGYGLPLLGLSMIGR